LLQAAQARFALSEVLDYLAWCYAYTIQWAEPMAAVTVFFAPYLRSNITWWFPMLLKSNVT
jgi:hypothetical protein